MQREHISLTEPLGHRVKQVIEKTADNYSSMHQDIQHQRKTEITHINGFICQWAKQLDIEVPENARVLAQVDALEN